MTDPTHIIESTNDHSSRSPVARLRTLWDHRELVGNLTRRELKVKYSDSILGLVWTLLNPLLYLVVFSIVFTELLRSGVPRYGIFLLSGLLGWTLFSAGVTGATSSIVANGPLVQKIWFPREVLPIASIAAALVNFMFQAIVLAIGMAVLRHQPEWTMMWLLVPAAIVTIMLAVALGLVLSALNVYLRDIQHLLELAILAMFWFTPIVYQYDLIGESATQRFGASYGWIGLLNPMTSVVITFQRVLYNPTRFPAGSDAAAAFDLLDQPSSWYLRNLLIVGALAAVAIYGSLRAFDRLEADLGEEI